MGRVKLYVSIGGHNYWRLGTAPDSVQYLKEFPCKRVRVILSDDCSFYLDDQMGTYSHGTISHPMINRWIINNNLSREKGEPKIALNFNFSVNDHEHIYRYLGKKK